MQRAKNHRSQARHTPAILARLMLCVSLALVPALAAVGSVAAIVALSACSNQQPAEPLAPKPEVVTITKKNWQNYFEPDVIESVNIEFNDNGELTSGEAVYYLRVRDDVSDRIDAITKDTQVTPTISYHGVVTAVFQQAGISAFGDVIEDKGKGTEDCTLSKFVVDAKTGKLLLRLTSANYFSNKLDADGKPTQSYLLHYIDTKVTDITGTLAIYPADEQSDEAKDTGEQSTQEPADKQPVAETPDADQPNAKQPVAETPDAEQSADKQSAKKDQPAEKQSAGKQSTNKSSNKGQVDKNQESKSK